MKENMSQMGLLIKPVHSMKSQFRHISWTMYHHVYDLHMYSNNINKFTQLSYFLQILQELLTLPSNIADDSRELHFQVEQLHVSIEEEQPVQLDGMQLLQPLDNNTPYVSMYNEQESLS
jgi:hypothetical protein